jgi:energy-coupling factor transport system ATP-binding protein
MIEVHDLEFSYRLKDGNRLPALKGISLQISQGESVAIIGSNGSGKSTLARCLNGLLVSQRGEVKVDGRDVGQRANWEYIRRRVGMIFQNPDNQIVSTTVEREIAFGLENLALPSEQLRARVEEVLRQFHLRDLRHRPPHLLSGGEKQRLSIAAVLAMRPQYLILDEPTSLLDPVGRREVRELLQRLFARGDVTLVHITQFPEEAAEARRVLVLHEGELVLEGSPQEVFAQGDCLREFGLRQPFAIELADRLREVGVALPGPVQELDDLVAGIMTLPRRDRIPEDADEGRGGSGPERLAPAQRGRERIRVEDLCYRYSPGLPTERIALRQVDLSIGRGEMLGLVGPIGSGKSTLVQHLNALLQPSSGRVLVDNRCLEYREDELRKLRQKVGLVFQFPEKQLFEETVYQDVAFGPRNLELPEDEVDRRVRESLQLVGLDVDRFAPRSPFDLSGGEQRRVAIAGVLALGPEILILDEPFVGLDPKGCGQILDILQQLRRKGVTVVLITHNMDLAVSLADRLVVMREGTVAQDDTPTKIFASPKWVAQLGIDLPLATQLMAELGRRGWPVETPVLTMEGALEEILTKLAA